MKLSNEEKNFLDKICAVSCKDVNTVRDVLRAILIVSAKEVYAGSKTVNIPYVCRLALDTTSSDTVRLSAEPNDNFVKEVKAILSGDTSPTEEFIGREISKTLESILEKQ